MSAQIRKILMAKLARRKNHRIRVITASVRTTNRMNALLNESMQNKIGKKTPLLKSVVKKESVESDEIEEVPSKPKLEYFKTNFTMDHIYKLVESVIEDRLQWDRFNRMYDSYKSTVLAESLATEIKERVKALKHKRYRIVCFISVIEKQQQGVHYQMKYLMDSKLDNYATFTHERATYNIIATVFLVYKD